MTPRRTYLEAFSAGSEVKKLLRDTSDEEALAEAQEYTVASANAKGYFEGLYIADYESICLTHILPTAPYGKNIREGEALKNLQDNILSKRELTNVGILKIADSSKAAADSVQQVTIGIEQISGVVQTNSATAEESAAASATLSGQSENLKELIGRFRI